MYPGTEIDKYNSEDSFKQIMIRTLIGISTKTRSFIDLYYTNIVVNTVEDFY